MRLPVCCSALLGSVVLCAQQGTGNPTALRQACEQAFREWRLADANLERDVLTAAPGDILQRLKDAETRRAHASGAQIRYCEAIRERVKPLVNQPPPRANTSEAVALGKATAGDLAADDATLALVIKATPASSTARLRALRRQREQLTDLRNSYAQRQKILDQIGMLNAALDQDRGSLTSRHTNLVSSLAAERNRIDASKSGWDELYAAIRRKAVQRAAVSPPPASPRPANLPPSPTVTPVARSLAGNWTLIAPRPEKYGDPAAPLYGDVRVQLKLTETGDQLAGEYTGLVFVPPNEKYNPNVSFRFTAPLQGGEGRIQSPLAGKVKLERMDDTRIRISFQIDRTPKAASISFKTGGVKELRRQ